MAISWVGNAEAVGVDGGDVTLDISGLSLAQNDLVIVAAGYGDNDGVDGDMVMSTAGYTEVADLFALDTVDLNFGVFYKFMGASPDASAVFDTPAGAGADTAPVAVCQVFRGVKLVADGGPFDTAAVTATGTNGGIPDPPSIDHSAAAGIWTVIAGGRAHNQGAVTFTNPTGYTTNAVDSSGDDTTDSLVGMGYKEAPSDPEDPGVMTPSAADNGAFCWAAVTMALAPAAAAATANQQSVIIIGI